MDRYLTQPLEPDPVIEEYKKHVDLTLLLENLKLTPAQRLENMTAFCRLLEETRGRAGRGGPAAPSGPR